MRQDLTNSAVYSELTKGGIPPQVALRAAWLLGGRQTLYVDFAKTPSQDEAVPGTLHEVVIMTSGRVIHVLATERDEPDSHGRRFLFHAADVWARSALNSVAAYGDEAAWEALLTDAPIAATLDPITNRTSLRRYVLTFDNRPAEITIPLTHQMQDEADQVAACLAYDVKKSPN